MAVLVEVSLRPRSRQPRRVVNDPVTRQALARAYAILRRAPASPEAHLAVAELLIHTPRHNLIYRHIKRAMDNAPQTWGGLPALAEILFRIGEHAAARQVFDRAIDMGCMNPDALRTYAALLQRSGAADAAKRMLGASALMQPFVSPRHPKPGRPDVMRIRCFDNSRYAMGQRGPYKLWSRNLKSGHFSLAELTNWTPLNVHVASAYGDSLRLVHTVPNVGLAINSIACPDLNPGPLAHVSAYLGQFPDLPVINHPDVVLTTTRANNARRLNQIDGVVFPRTEPLTTAGSPVQMVAEFEALEIRYPVILRRAGTQTGVSMTRAENADDVLTYFMAARVNETHYAIEFIDQRDEEGRYRKTRAFFVDGQFFPVANLAHDAWQIHSGDRYSVMEGDPTTQERERHYLDDPGDYLGDTAMAALQGINEAIGLDFFGVDFTLLPDGQILVFEANAAMRHNFDHAGAFPYTRPHLERISRAFGAMIEQRANPGWNTDPAE